MLPVVKFLHCSDIHLGKQRLGGKLPDSDFARAFGYITGYAVEHKADALLIAGDLFDTPTIQPGHLRQATACLEPLRQAGIPVFAIEGNHDRPSISGEAPTWVRYLNDEGYLHLLSIPFDSGGPQVTAWDPAARRGSYYDIKGVRIVGAGYLGAFTVRRMRLIADALKELSPANTDQHGVNKLPLVMLLHAGPEYMVREGGGFSQDSLSFLKEQVDYLALGHIHKPMAHEGWAFNPGSAENVRLEECRYDKDHQGNDTARGMVWVEMDTNSVTPLQRAEILPLPRRPVVTLRYDCSPYGNKNRGAVTAIRDDIIMQLHALEVDGETAVRLELYGQINIGKVGLEPETLALELEQALPALAVDINMTGLELFTGRQANTGGIEVTQSRDALERTTIAGLLEEQPLAGLEDCGTELSDLFYMFKEDVKAGVKPEDILDRLARSPLAGRLTQARRSEAGGNETADAGVEVAVGLETEVGGTESDRA